MGINCLHSATTPLKPSHWTLSLLCDHITNKNIVPSSVSMWTHQYVCRSLHFTANNSNHTDVQHVLVLVFLFNALFDDIKIWWCIIGHVKAPEHDNATVSAAQEGSTYIRDVFPSFCSMRGSGDASAIFFMSADERKMALYVGGKNGAITIQIML